MIPADTPWLKDTRAQRVCRVLGDAGHQIYFVGGCVRNALLGLPDSDVDMSTDATPTRVMALASDAGIKAIPTGIDHGTVTLVVNGAPFEVTTFRRDVATDGRRAVVSFSTDIADDAARRDFTMNALYADAAGRLIDPLDGIEDLHAGRVRFILNPDDRIKEDYLRTLRFFRFSAWYAGEDMGFDPEALAAISANLDGLETLSAERVGQEVTKLLQAIDPVAALAVMRQTGVLHRLFPGADDRMIGPFCHFEQAFGVAINWRSRLALLGGEMADRMRLSRADKKQTQILRDLAFTGPKLMEVAYRHGLDLAQQVALMRATLAEAPPDQMEWTALDQAARAVFPLKASDLMPQLSGPALGQTLKSLEARWIASGFTLSRNELLNGR